MSLHLVLMFAGLVTLASVHAKPSSLIKSHPLTWSKHSSLNCFKDETTANGDNWGIQKVEDCKSLCLENPVCNTIVFTQGHLNKGYCGLRQLSNGIADCESSPDWTTYLLTSREIYDGSGSGDEGSGTGSGDDSGDLGSGKTPETPSIQSPRIVEIEFLIDNEWWNEYQEKYGKNPMANITEEIDQLLYDASQYLAKLDNGGYKLHLQKPLKRLENSQFELSSTYRDRRNDNLTRRLDKNDVVGYDFAFQDTVSQMVSQGWKTKPNIVRYILASACPETWCRVGGLSPEAASEEVCLCHPETFPCIGIFTTKTSEEPSPLLLAHEIGHTLGSYHDEELGYIMSEPITGYEWSPGSRQQINDNNLGCLERETTNRPTDTSTIPPTD